MCYVGKASKIFIGIVVVLVIVGMILAFRWVRHEPNHKSRQQQCEGNRCSPPSFYPQPIPATAVAAPPFSTPTPPGPQAGSALSPEQQVVSNLAGYLQLVIVRCVHNDTPSDPDGVHAVAFSMKNLGRSASRADPDGLQTSSNIKPLMNLCEDSIPWHL
ncbi:hypothetical protein EJ110_NYTH42896 [Nymphaea thermarum]|nr:hypothetical protein EJ110_NYTH42896 [Nymphaea thermarum]